MKRVLVSVVVLLSACGGGVANTSSASAGASDVEEPTTIATTATTVATEDPTTTLAEEEAAGAIPAGCAEGFTEYLLEIEPIVAGFDPAPALLVDFLKLDEAVGDKSIELLAANDYNAPYSCSGVGLEWAYFDTGTPWEGVLEIAQNEAPGTVAYLGVVRREAAINDARLSDYGVEGCDVAVERIRQTVAEQTAAGVENVANMGIDAGLEALGVYNAYMYEVQHEACPRDELGNDEFGFMYPSYTR